MAADADAFVRATLWDLLKADRYRHQRRLDDAEAIAGEIARYARACTRLDLEALSILRKLTVADVLAELAEHDLEQHRRAAYQLAWSFSGITKTALEGLPDDPADRLLSDADPLLRSHGIAAVRRFRVARLHPRLRELQKAETDPWVQHWLSWCLAEQPTRDDPWSPAAPGYADEPPVLMDAAWILHAQPEGSTDEGPLSESAAMRHIYPLADPTLQNYPIWVPAAVRV